MENRTENEILFASMFEGKTVHSAIIYEDKAAFLFTFTDGTCVCIEASENNMIAYNPDGEPTEHVDGEPQPMTPEEILEREG